MAYLDFLVDHARQPRSGVLVGVRSTNRYHVLAKGLHQPRNPIRFWDAVRVRKRDETAWGTARATIPGGCGTGLILPNVLDVKLSGNFGRAIRRPVINDRHSHVRVGLCLARAKTRLQRSFTIEHRDHNQDAGVIVRCGCVRADSVHEAGAPVSVNMSFRTASISATLAGR